MVFIDLLTAELFAIGFAGLGLAYLVCRGYCLYKNGSKNTGYFKSAALPIGVFGFYILLTGLYGQFTWPLPGAYNILFYDVYTLAGLVFIALALALRTEAETHYVGFFGLLVGAMAVYYGNVGYGLGLTSAPLALLGLYSLLGLAGIFGYPMTLIVDKLRSGSKIKGNTWALVVLAFMLCMVFGSLLAIFIAASAVPAHLMNPP